MVSSAHTVAAVLMLGTAACVIGDVGEAGSTCADRRAADVVQAAASLLPTQCGATLDLTPINRYQGELASVQEREDAVVLINGTCTGTLIAATDGPIVLTAGHCAELGDSVLVAFNSEDERDGDPLVTNGLVIERADEPDYALVRLDQLPAVTPTLLTTRPTDVLAIIQHPRGLPKVIAEGRLQDSCDDARLVYGHLDTSVGSSGAGVLNEQGYLLGIHTDGDCAADGSGANRGWTAASVVQASAYLQASDIADR